MVGVRMSRNREDALTVHCPTCGANPGSECAPVPKGLHGVHVDRYTVFDRNNGPKESGVFWYRNADDLCWHIGEYDSKAGLWSLMGYEAEGSTLDFRIAEWRGPLTPPD